MKNGFLWIILVTISSFFTNCAKYNITNGESVTLYSCSSTNETYICFDSLLTDSRCPENAECIWSGNALIKVSFHETDNTHKFTMSLKGFPGEGYPSDTSINGYRIVFTELKPYPNTDKPIPQNSEIKASFSISH